ncbi:MAG: DUF3341 domain-containing protein [Candidatus Polarisedimenticolia bacterium]
MISLLKKRPLGTEYGYLAEFDTPRALHRACGLVRDAGYTHWDAHTPFPIHGLEKAMGLRDSRLGWVVLAMGLGGAAGAMVLQWWVSTIGYPLVISGKPLFSWQAFVPVMFELGVMGGVLGAVFGMFAFNQLPTWNHPLFNSTAFERVTDDRFFISIETLDPKFNREGTGRFLQEIGATRVEMVPR